MKPRKRLPLTLALLIPAVSASSAVVQVAPVEVPGAAGFAPAAIAAVSSLNLGGLSLGTPGLRSFDLGPTLSPPARITPSLPSAGQPSLSLPQSAMPRAAAAPAASAAGAVAIQGPAVAQAAQGALGNHPSDSAVRDAGPGAAGLGAARASAAPAPVALRERLSAAVAQVREAASRPAGPAGIGVRSSLDQLFLGSRESRAAAVDASASPVVNDEGVRIFGRAPAYYREVRRLVEKYEGRLDLSESLDVMEDSYGDVWAKLKALEAVSRQRKVEQHNTHLERTLMWVDGVMNDHGRTVAVNTYRVYYHRSPNPRSEIEEGIRRADNYLKEALSYFSQRGQAEKAMGRLDEILLVFDTRGYAEVKAHLKQKEAEFTRLGRRFKFAYLDELAPQLPKSEERMREELNALISRYEKDEGLGKIIEGVIYGRYVGLLLELKTIEHYLEKGYEILQSGHELFDADKKYVTELDAVVRDPATGRVAVVEAKSARVPLPFSRVLHDKVLAKLETYAKNRAALEKDIGRPVDDVVFSFDVGSNRELVNALRGQEEALSKKYGFKVSFLFIDSSPKEVKVAKTKKRR